MKAFCVDGIFAALLTVFLLLAPDTSLANDASLIRIEKAGVLRLGICEEDFRPFSFHSGTTWVGYDITLATDIAHSLGVRLEIITDPNWEGLVELIHEGKVDLANLSISPRRTRKLAFSQPGIYLRQGVLANQLALAKLTGTTPIMKLNTPKAVIATRTGSIYREILSDYLPLATTREFPTWEECYAAVKSGEVTGVIGDEAKLFSWMGRHKGDSIRLSPVFFEGKQDILSIAVARDNTDLLDYINAFLLNRPQVTDIQRLYWQYKDDNPVEDSGQSIKGKIPAAEYPVFITAASLAALMLAYLMLLSLRGNRRK